MGHYQLGSAFQQKGNTQQAKSEWREAVRLRPNFSEAWKALGVNALQHGDWRELEPIADQLKTIAPRAAEGYLYHATARMNQGDASAAEADLNQLLLIAPNSALGYVKLGQLRVAQQRLDEAERMYRQGLARDPHSLVALEGLVNLDLLNKKPAQALRLIQEQLDSNSQNAALYLLQGKALLQNKQPEEAEHSLERTVEMDGQNVSALVLLAEIESSLGKFDRSIASYQRAIGVAPNEVRLYVALGRLHESQGDWQQAQTLYQKALAIQPEDALAANNLAYIMIEHQESVNVALTLAQTARRGLPNLPNSADTLGWAYYHNGAYSVVVIRPAKRICGIRQVRQSAPSGLSERKSYIHTFPVLDHDVGQVVRCEGVFGLHRQRLLVKGLGLLPIALTLIDAAQRDIEPDIIWRNSNGSLIGGNRLIKLSER